MAQWQAPEPQPATKPGGPKANRASLRPGGGSSEMFEEMVVSNAKNKKTNKPWTVVLSMLLQVGFLAILILIPLIYTEALPKTLMSSILLAPPPPPKAAVTRTRVGGAVQAAKLVNRVQPVYPPLARQTRISGTVKLHAIIGKDGTVQQLQVVSGHPLLVQAALDAVKQWRYQPTLLNGEPVEVDTEIDVIFSLAQ